MNIHLLKLKERQGPYSVGQVVEMIQRGEHQLSDLAWREGMSEWRPLHSMQDVVNLVVPPCPGINQSQSNSSNAPEATSPLSLDQGQKAIIQDIQSEGKDLQMNAPHVRAESETDKPKAMHGESFTGGQPQNQIQQKVGLNWKQQALIFLGLWVVILVLISLALQEWQGAIVPSLLVVVAIVALFLAKRLGERQETKACRRCGDELCLPTKNQSDISTVKVATICQSDGKLLEDPDCAKKADSNTGWGGVKVALSIVMGVVMLLLWFTGSLPSDSRWWVALMKIFLVFERHH